MWEFFLYVSALLPACEEIGSFRAPNSCHHYYDCLYYGKGEIVQSRVKKCRGCFVFNSQLGICDIPEHVPECSANPKASNCTSEGYFLVPGSTSAYYVCKKNAEGFIHRETRECGGERIKNCTFLQNITLFSDEKGFKCTENGFFSHPNDCNKFIHCVKKVNGTFVPEVKSCSSRLFFNEVGGYCDHPENILSLEESYDVDVR